SADRLMLAVLIVLSILLAETTAQISKAEQIGCLNAATNMANAEKDKDLQKMMKKTIETIADMAMDMTTELTEEQRKRVGKTYFTGKCTQLTITSLFE
ncbi:hypothetical protein PMAYCL1PPCAC_33035, partial [Pristionchus mayeri]